MMLAVRLLGAHPLAVLLPQLLETVAAVVVLGATVWWAGRGRAAVVAALLLAAGPVTFALARFDDPDTMLLLASVVVAYAVVRAAADPRKRWLVLLGAALGAAFLTKWLAGLVVVPAVARALCGPAAGPPNRAVLVTPPPAVPSRAWWVGVLAVLGPDRRPYADSSSGSLLHLVLGSNGVSRLSGDGGGAISGHPGPWRLLLPPFADQSAWYLPAALVAAALLLLDRTARSGAVGGSGPGSPAWRAAVRLFGGWLVVAAVLFSAMGGAMHPYYTSYLAAPAAALLGLAAARVGRGWASWRPILLVLVAGTTGALALGATGRSLAGLAGVAVAAAVLAAVGLAGRTRRGAVVGGVAALVAVLVGPAATDWATLHVVVNGADPRAGWSQHGVSSVPPAALVAFLRAGRGDATWAAAVPEATPAAQLQLASGLPVLPIGGFTGAAAAPSTAQLARFVEQGRLRYLVLEGRYRTDPAGTPAGLAGRPVATVVDWARARACPERVAGVTVLDLGDPGCVARR